MTGRGIACVCYEGDNGYVAMVADVAVDQDTGRIQVTRLVVAQDSGPISNPDGMRSQIEGGSVQGISRALGEEVTWDDRKITSIDWRTYQSLSVGYAPPVDGDRADQSDRRRRPAALVRQRSPSLLRRLAMPSSMRQA